MSSPLPIKLNAAPIIDAVIEIRVGTKQSLNTLMPDTLRQMKTFGFLDYEPLPVSNIPAKIRQQDPNLKFQPLSRIKLEDGFSVLIGDQVLAVVSSIPYVGGVTLKEKSLQIINALLDLSVVESIQRVSIKYTDFIETNNLKELADYLNLDFNIGSAHSMEVSGYDLNFHIKKENMRHLIRAVALVQINNRQGVILDIDTIKSLETTNLQEFIEILSKELDEIHIESKKQFFALLTEKALKELGAVYE